ncbi:DUF4124 domain-containing protein [Psychromonas antarctica]|uniref:DUF4124 domain-containing protein n=1 Tax=Psychromonas antarctica TaxID=67573 RepID=UPI001EE99F9D|nr:DUF4124 domain-containing protein [Psychromonas antarctica]MCG6201173.1 DUF4124 domain-containing protein [Psychromonas antarctica]
MPYILTLLILLFSVSTSAEIFTWQDAKGVTHFSESKPEYDAQITIIEELAKPTVADADADAEIITKPDQAEAPSPQNESDEKQTVPDEDKD